MRSPSFLPLLLGLSLVTIAAVWSAEPPQTASSPEAPRAERPRAQAERQRNRLQQELKRLQDSGKQDQAAEVRKKIEELDRQLAESGPRPQTNQGQRRDPSGVERPDGPSGPEQPDGNRGFERREPQAFRADQPDRERRLHHLELAIDNLHAAGMHEPAERLSLQLERMRNVGSGPGRPAGNQMARPMPEEMRQLRAELQELRRNIQELRGQLEELRRRP